MTTRQIILICVASLVLVGIVTWIVYPKYGSGYSEDQRRNWNEWLATPKYSSDPFCDSNPFCTVSSEEEQFDKAPKAMQAIITRKKANDAPRMEVSIPLHPDITKLPLEGMTQAELVNLAEAGNGKIHADACLELVYRRLADELSKLGLGPSLSREMEKWLGKAIAMNRPGARFLLEFYHHAQRDNPTLITDSLISSMEGYEEFLKEIRKGDLPLCKVWSTFYLYDNQIISEHFCSDMKNEDISSMKNRGFVFFIITPLNEWFLFDLEQEKENQQSVAREWGYSVKRTLNINSKTQRTLESIFISAFKILGLYQKSEFTDRLNKNSELLKRAADNGDMTAKYLWLLRGLYHKEFFTQEEWEATYSYTADLLKAGFAPVCEYLTYGDSYTTKYWGMHYAFYKTESINSLCVSSKEALLTRGCKNEISNNLNTREWSKESNAQEDEQIISLLDFLGRIDPPEMISFHGVISEYASANVYKNYVPLLEKAAQEGYHAALYSLAHIYDKGDIIPENPQKAWAIYQRMSTLANSFSEDARLERWEYKNRAMPFDYAIRCSLIDFVLRRGDQPDMTIQQAWEEYLALESKIIRSNEANKSSMNYEIKRITTSLEEFKKEFEQRGMKMSPAHSLSEKH